MRKFTAMVGGEPTFVDTNVLLSACDADREKHEASVSILGAGLRGEVSLFASGQIFREYLVVATRLTDKNGLGMQAEMALANIEEFSRCLRLLDETVEYHRRLRDLVRRHELRGKRIHDANVVATMQEHGLNALLTDNADDYNVFQQLTIIPVE